MRTPARTRKSSNTLAVTEAAGKSRARLRAELGLSSIVPNSRTAQSFGKKQVGELDLCEVIDVMTEKARAVRSGDLTGLEEMLAVQAIALDAILNELANRAAVNLREHIQAAETYLRLALKAQGQCRATVETLSEMKFPRHVAFVKQANIAQGPQQVNNGMRPPDTRAEIMMDHPNGLKGLGHEQRLDAGAPGAAGGLDTRVQTMDAIHRAKE